MKFLILLFATCVFAKTTTYTHYYEDTGEYCNCIYDYDEAEVNIYAGTSFINATVLPNLCYQINIGIFGAVVTGNDTKLIIQNGEITSLITNGIINDYSNSTLMVYNSQVILRKTTETMDDWAIALIVISGVLLLLLIIIIASMGFGMTSYLCKSAENIPLIKN